MSERPYFVQCDAVGTPPIEMFSVEKQKKNLILANTADFTDTVKDLTQKAKFWLPIAAERLSISPNISDYVLTPVISMPSDLPNRNIQAFPFKELTAWCTDGGDVMYKTWKGKPTYVEHANKDPSKSRGIIVDCVMRPIQNTSIWKVIKLMAWDRNKDPNLVNNILAKSSNAYSMGANAEDFSCSVCSSLYSKGGCEHLAPLGSPPVFKKVGNRLAYYNVINPIGFECSWVNTPAYVSAMDAGKMAWLTS